jgi:hypothetical protein
VNRRDQVYGLSQWRLYAGANTEAAALMRGAGDSRELIREAQAAAAEGRREANVLARLYLKVRLT